MSLVSNIVAASAEIEKLSEKAGLPIDKFIKAATVLRERELFEQSNRRSTDDEKAAIMKYLGDLNGSISPDLPVGDILAGAGVRKVQGTMSFASRELKRVLQITHSR